MEKDEIKVYGASDDLVEVEGAQSEEYGCYQSDVFVFFKDGTEIAVHYDDEHEGIWKIKTLRKGEAYASAKKTSLDKETEETYTEEFFIRGTKIDRVVIGRVEREGGKPLRFEDLAEAA
jgi:hypothetical protein